MFKTKNVLAAAMIAALVIPAFQGCKGEGDPFISLKSRKARVAGEWKFSKLKDESTSTETSSSGQTSTDNTIYEVDGATARVTIAQNSQGFSMSATGSGAAVATANFEKDGVFTIKYTLTNVNLNYDGDIVVMNTTYEANGTWNFLGGVEEDYKKKERIILNKLKEVTTNSYSSGGATSSETTTDTYANGEASEVWHLTTLKNKEMVMEATRNSVSSYNSSYTDGTTNQVESGTSTSKGGMTGTLTQD